MRQSDFVSLHCRLTEATRGMITARQLALMKPSAYFINVGRGELVDQRALDDALRDRRIAGAGLDVFERRAIAARRPADRPRQRDPDAALVGVDLRTSGRPPAGRWPTECSGPPAAKSRKTSSTPRCSTTPASARNWLASRVK